MGDPFIIVNDGGFPETTKRISQSFRWHFIGGKCRGTMTAGKLGYTYMHAWGFPEANNYLH
jgi:hypothetical protein